MSNCDQQHRLRVLHVVPTFYPASYFGGPIFSLYGLCNALVQCDGSDMRVLTTDSNGPASVDRLQITSFPVKRPEGYAIYYCRKSWGREFSLGLLRQLPAMIRWADVVHLTGVYSFTTLPVLIFCRLVRKPLVWSPRGALQRWEGSTRPVPKTIWERLCNWLLVPARSLLHVTSEGEATESGARISRAYVEIVRNGVDIPAIVPGRAWKPDGKLRLLYLGRLSPKKGIENLLKAMQQFDDSVLLTICGTGTADYVASLESIASQLGLVARVRFVGHVDGAKKSDVFWESDICVVPSYTENFGMVVAEALAHGTPVIASRGTPWQEIEEHGCGRWIDNDPTSLAAAIAELRQQDLRQMGEKGREWMRQHYSWPVVAREMLAVYRRLAPGAA